MGTYYTRGATRESIVEYILQPLREGNHLRAARVRREAIQNGHDWVLWTVEGGTKPATGQAYQFIGCYVLRDDPSGWGYKPMDETMCPFYYSCPLDWVDGWPCVLPTNMAHMRPHSDDWRESVRSVAAEGIGRATVNA